MTAHPPTTGAAPSATPEPVTWQPRGHLVGWAGAILAVAIVVLGTSAVFGLLTPRVSTDHGVTSGLAFDADDTVFATFEVSNEAYGTARLTGADASVPGMSVDTVSFEPLDGATGRADGSVDLRHRESAVVTIRWHVTDCGLVPEDAGPIGLEMRTPVGLTRTVDAGTVTRLLDGSPGTPQQDWPVAGWARSLASRVCGPEGGEPGGGWRVRPET